MTFSFYLQDMFCPSLSKIDQSGGLLQTLFSSRRSKNLQNEKIFFYLEIAEIELWVEKNDSGHKTPFLKVKPVFSG